nr:hypothetical protein [Tanacetum cinerariifolium]
MWLKGRVNKDKEFTDDEIRSVGDKLLFGKEKGGYARGVGSEVTYKRYFHLPRSRQATDERIELLQTQLDNERRERQQKDVLVKKLSTEMTEKDEKSARGKMARSKNVYHHKMGRARYVFVKEKM